MAKSGRLPGTSGTRWAFGDLRDAVDASGPSWPRWAAYRTSGRQTRTGLMAKSGLLQDLRDGGPYGTSWPRVDAYRTSGPSQWTLTGPQGPVRSPSALGRGACHQQLCARELCLGWVLQLSWPAVVWAWWSPPREPEGSEEPSIKSSGGGARTRPTCRRHLRNSERRDTKVLWMRLKVLHLWWTRAHMCSEPGGRGGGVQARGGTRMEQRKDLASRKPWRLHRDSGPRARQGPGSSGAKDSGFLENTVSTSGLSDRASLPGVGPGPRLEGCSCSPRSPETSRCRGSPRLILCSPG